MKYAIIFIILLASCAPHHVDVSSCAQDAADGFWAGLWHGSIAVITFVFSLFTDVSVYSVNNTGGWYDFGFMLGIGALSSGSTAATRRRR